ncbi:MAG: hypothetical protein JSV35_01850 [Candidatus Bathyarchaeota archaeon]|nr:MAG: hypothetical protein JSV35_01850 [Candidatus Bathyarchaeota archaeon]
MKKATIALITLLLISTSLLTLNVTASVQSASSVTFNVTWANYRESVFGDRYPFGGNFHNGDYPVWKNFTVCNDQISHEDINYISVHFPEGFQPVKYEISVTPIPCEWRISINLADRLVEFAAEEGDGVDPGACALVSIEFEDGPVPEGPCDELGVFEVTVASLCCAETFRLREYYDDTPPSVDITFPLASDPGGAGFAFVKKGGSIWVQTPTSDVEDIGWLWINGTAWDNCSGINRIEIWINGTYVGDADLSRPGSPTVPISWSWYCDPTHPQPPIPPGFWESESWYSVVARAYDCSVNNKDTVRHGTDRIPLTNYQETDESWFFWIGEEPAILRLQDKPLNEGGQILSWVPGNGRVDVNGTTGWYPNGIVHIWLENDLYNIRKYLTNVTADNYGRFYTAIHHLPEVPRKPTCEDRWIIRAVDDKQNEGADRLAIVPWITYEETLSQNVQTTWDSTESGNVGGTIIVYGHGFLPSRQAAWNPSCTVNIQIIYTDVAPLTAWCTRDVFTGISQYELENLEWYPKLDTQVLATTTTDENGYWSAEITIPQSYGGLHAIYACEYSIVPDPQTSCPNVDLVCSGWKECTGNYDSTLFDKEAQAVIFDVLPTIEVSPSTAITNQYVTIIGEGLPLPKYYELWIDGVQIYASRDWCFVLDFGPFEQWVYENKRVLNNEFDQPWATGMWYPFAFYSPDPADSLLDPFDPESLVWHGKLCSILFDWSECHPVAQIHRGSQFLKIPMITPGDYPVNVYYYDKNAGDFTHDYEATTTVGVLKDPLYVNLDVGKTHVDGERIAILVEVNVDGIPSDPSTLHISLYRGDTFLQELPCMNARIGVGLFACEFDCPEIEGDYFIRASASKHYGSFTLHGTAISGFTVTSMFNRLVKLEDNMATVLTELGEVLVHVSDLNAKVVKIEGSIATIETDLGLLKTNVTDINAEISEIEGSVARIETDLGDIQTNTANIDARVVDINNGMFTIQTTIGTVEASAQKLDAVIAAFEDDIVIIHTAIGQLQVKLEDLNGVIEIAGNIATIKTELGELKGEVVDMQGKVITIDTEMGRITTKADSIKQSVALQPASIALSLIAALAAIAATALILRKVYIK